MSIHRKISAPTLLSLASSSAFGLEPAELNYNEIFVKPTIQLATTYDDNYLAIPEAESSWIGSIKPKIEIAAYGDKTEYLFQYVLNQEIYGVVDASNLTSHMANGKANIDFDIRNRLSLSADYSKTEAAANAYTAGELNAFSKTTLGADYTYGAPTATGRVELGLNNSILRSDNGVNLDQERDFTTYNVTFIYKASAITSLTAEIIGTDTTYVSNTALNNLDVSYLAGARWEATSQTTGYIKLGKEYRDFDDSALPSTDLSSWEARVAWAPRTYSVITLTTNQKIDEGLYGADYIESLNNAITWDHDWGQGYSSQANYTNSHKDYSSGRVDKVNAYGLGITYMARRWMDVSFDYQFTDQNSTDPNYDYQRGIYRLTLSLSL